MVYLCKLKDADPPMASSPGHLKPWDEAGGLWDGTTEHARASPEFLTTESIENDPFWSGYCVQIFMKRAAE